jgi:predicted glycosyltransferase
MSERLKILMYSPDSIGLGHMRRNSTIATEVVRQAPSSSIALLVGSGAGAFFAAPKGIDTIKLPSVQKIAADKWVPRSLNLSVRQTSSLRAGIIRNVVATLRPDVFLIDHMPMGVCGDLVPALELIEAQRMGTRVVLGIRDILDEPALIRRRWAQLGYYEFIARHYHAVLAYGDESVFPTAQRYGLADVIDDGVVYTGYVCDARRAGDDATRRAIDTRSLEGLSAWQEGERIVVASGGGGHDAYPMLAATARALRLLDAEPGTRSVVIAGPLMPEPDRRKLEQLTLDLQRTRLVPWTADCMDYFARADVSVVMGGYNSTLEALSTTARVIMMPRTGPSAEQSIRARMLAERGHLQCLDAAAVSPAELASAIHAAAHAPPRRPIAAMFEGAARAARALLAECHRGTAPEFGQRISREASRYAIF